MINEMFADDTIVLLVGVRYSFESTLKLFEIFGKMFGFKLNYMYKNYVVLQIGR